MASEDRILESLRYSIGRSVSDVATRAGLDQHATLSALTALDAANRVEATPNGWEKL